MDLSYRDALSRKHQVSVCLLLGEFLRLLLMNHRNGTDLYLCLLRDLAATPTKWSRLGQISIGFGSKLEVPEECLELVRVMRHDRPRLKSNIARCRQWYEILPRFPAHS